VNISTRPTRRVLGVAVAIAALGVLASCGHTTPTAQVPASNPVSSVSAMPKQASSVASAQAASVTTLVKTVATTIAPSGDAVLDAMDKDLTALEQETVSLDSAAVDSQDPAK
jgi:phenylpropionate dioxygenase-like ring-hydroxylating dioxygenase large terminal subunit